MNRRAVAIVLVVMLALVSVAAPAAAQGPTARGYDESRVLGEIQNESGTPPSTTTKSLPFTGLDLGIVALMGAGLLGTGLVLRRNARQE
jgi:hypothetical protein